VPAQRFSPEHLVHARGCLLGRRRQGVARDGAGRGQRRMYTKSLPGQSNGFAMEEHPGVVFGQQGTEP
jgi:hypothetical protein